MRLTKLTAIDRKMILQVRGLRTIMAIMAIMIRGCVAVIGVPCSSEAVFRLGCTSAGLVYTPCMVLSACVLVPVPHTSTTHAERHPHAVC